jgi:hypothetical protein
METTSYDLTPQQKTLLAALAQETGQPIPALLEKALEALRKRYTAHAQGKTTGSEANQGAAPTLPRPQHIGEIADELFGEIPNAELARLLVDGAAQHDHYLYGLPKRFP